MLTEATAALAGLDSERLESLASRLQALLTCDTLVATTPEIAARQRVFASVLRATGENLAILKRVAYPAAEGDLWVL